jgi:hypothetical protein
MVSCGEINGAGERTLGSDSQRRRVVDVPRCIINGLGVQIDS